jgi:hypothetical protein
VFVLAFVLIAAMCTLWALASPIFSVPDENAHAVKAIAQVRGEIVGHRIDGVRQLVVDVPATFAVSPDLQCFVAQPTHAANCPFHLGDPGGSQEAVTQVSTYNPIYYYLVGWPSLIFTGSTGIYAMRIMSAILGALFLAAAFQLAVSSARARWMPLGVVFATMPMVLYLNGAVNPNGLEIASAVALWVALLRLFERFDERRQVRWSVLPVHYLWGVVAISGIMLANARALGPLWVVIVVAICIVASGWQPLRPLFTTRSSYWWLGAIAVGGIFSLLWTLSGGSLSGQAEKADAPLVGASFVSGFVYTIRTLNATAAEAIGTFGWLDAPVPGAAYWIFVAALTTVVVLAFVATGRRGTLVLTLTVAACVLVPALVQAYSVHQTGIIWQGRYGIFLYLAVPIIAAWFLSGERATAVGYLSARITWVSVTLLWLYGVVAFFFVMRRYVIGNGQSIGHMISNPLWQPPLGWVTLVVLFVLVSAGFSAWVGWLGMRSAREADLEPVAARVTVGRA